MAPSSAPEHMGVTLSPHCYNPLIWFLCFCALIAAYHPPPMNCSDFPSNCPGCCRSAWSTCQARCTNPSCKRFCTEQCQTCRASCPKTHSISHRAYSPYSITESVFEEVLPLLAKRRAVLQNLKTNTTKWRLRKQAVRKAFSELFAPLPARNRAAPTTVERGTVDGEGIVLRLLLVETKPGYWATAGVWLPKDNKNSKIPAILFPSGHSANSFREESAQLVAANLCRRGFAVLGYDPIGQGERRMLPDLDGPGGSTLNMTEHHSPAFEHEYLQRQVALLGVNAASLWLSELTVMLDVLSALPQVDAARLGVAGCSGGGVQSAYISAMDPRVTASSIACYESVLTVDYAPAPAGGGGPAEGEQQWGPFVAGGRVLLDKPDLLVARAPKPTQVLLTTEDQYFPLIGGEAAVTEAQPAFKALGNAGGLTYTVGVNKHGLVNTTRLALYAFMMRELQGTLDSGVELPIQFFTSEQMRVTSTGSVLTAPEINAGKGSVTAHKAFVQPIADNLLARLRTARADKVKFLDQVKSSVAAAIGYRPPAVRMANVSVQKLNMPGVFLLSGEGRCKVALQVLNRTAPSAVRHHEEAVLYVSRKGGTLRRPHPGQLSPVETTRIEAVRAKGYTVVLVDVCGFGTLGDKSGDAFGLFALPTRGLYRVHLSTPVDAAFNVNRSIVAYHAADIIRAAYAVASGALLGEPLRNVVATISTNETAAAVLSAAVVSEQGQIQEQKLGAIAVLASVASWTDIVSAERFVMSAYYSFVFGGLQTFDMPDLCAALQVPTLVAAPLDAEQHLLSDAHARARFEFAQKANSRLTVDSARDPSVLTDRLLKWLASTRSTAAHTL